MTKVDLTSFPYFDDYSEAKGFYKILFRPGRALQARELTQIQTNIQKQLQRLGSHIFKDKALVYPSSSMGCVYTTNTVFVKVPKSEGSFTHNDASIKNYWLNKDVRTAASVSGTCIGYSITGEFVRLYIDLKTASTDNTRNNFAGGDTIYVDVTGTSTSGQVQTISTISANIETTSNSVGRIACVEIPSDSVYFYNGYYVLVDNQFLFIEPSDPENDLLWGANPTCLVCLEMTESIVTFEDDASLLDNANGSTNFAAPGADRLRIEAKLTAKDFGTTDQNIIKLLTLRNGILSIAHQLDTDPYNSPLKEQLAKRTYDESGNYTVRPFLAEALPFLVEGDARGAFLENELSFEYNSTDSTNEVEAMQKAADCAKDIFELDVDANGDPKIYKRVGVNRYYPGTSYDDVNDPTSFVNLCEERIGITVDPGAAYIRGYQQEKNGVTYTSVKKSRTSDFISNKTIQTPLGTNIKITNVFGFPTIQSTTTGELSYGKINFHRTGIANNTAPQEVIGTARLCSIELFSGTKGQSTAVYKLFVFDMSFVNGFDYSDVKSISNSSGTTFLANAVLKDPAVDPTLRFTGLIYKQASFSTSGMTHTYVTSSGYKKIEITLPVGTTTPTLLDTAKNLSVGTAVAIKTSSSDTSEDIRLITAVTLDNTASPTKVTIELNQALDTTTLGTGAVLRVVYKVLGVGTLWKSSVGEQVEKGDMVSIGTGASKTTYVVYSTPVNDNELNLIALDGTDPIVSRSWADGAVMNYLKAEGVSDDNLGSAGLVFRLPHNTVRTIRGGERNAPNNSIISANYIVRRYEKKSSASSTTSFTFNLVPSSNEEFVSGHENYSLVDLDTGKWIELYSSATSISGSNKATVTITATTTTFNLTTATKNVGAILAVEKSSGAANAGTKTLVKGSFTTTGTSVYTGGGFTVVTNSDNKEITLKRSNGSSATDVLRITRIVESRNLSAEPSSRRTSAINPDTTEDGDKIITGAYYLDTGQTDYYYGVSKAILRPGFNAPKGQIRIEFDYFEHSSTGDYFSVDSYPWKTVGTTAPQMSYEEIPEYKSTNYGTFDLRGCLDFRPIVDNTTPTQSGDLKFSRFKETPKDGFTCSYHVYESRKDKLYINTEGQIKIKYGVPGIISGEPVDPTDGMTLYDIDLQPYTASHKGCVLKMRDNRRYTMRDIGKLDNRIKNLEYYTTLSLVEKDTKDLDIKDALGNDKFKHGFMIDSFQNPVASDTTHPDWDAAPDFITGELKPKIVNRNITIIEKPGVDRFAQNYKKIDSQYFLEYTHTTYMEQPLCSRVMNVNPYQTIAFIGTLNLTPETDTWREIEVAEPKTVYDSEAYNLTLSSYGRDGTSTNWNGTVQVWTGVESEKTRKPSRVITAGHAWPAKDGIYKDKNGKLINGTGRPREGQKVMVPPGFENSGQMVEYSYVGQGQNVYENTRTQTGYEQATGIKNSIKDLGYTEPVSMGSKIVDIKAAEFIRTNEVSFVGKGFLPNSKMYAYFDDVDVTRFCMPETGSGNRVESSLRRGPISNLRVVFGQSGNSITLQTFSALRATDSSGRSLANFGYSDIGISSDLYDDSKLSGNVSIVKVNDEWYVTGTNFENELVPGSVLVLNGVTRTDSNGNIVPVEFEVVSLGENGANTNTRAKLKIPPAGVVEVDNKPCADKLEALQRLYVGKYVDIKGSTDSSRNVVDAKILSLSYVPANGEVGSGLLNEPKLTFTLETKDNITKTTDPTGESGITISIKDASSAAGTSPPSAISLTCDSTGKIKGKFIIPDPKVEGNPKFKTGERTFRLTNSATNENINTVSRSDAKYIARGWVDVQQETFYSTRAFKQSAEIVYGDKTPTSLTDSYQTLGRVCQKDPIAQSFVVEDSTGIYITAVDVFFFSKDPTLPVTLQIRPLSDNGEPSTRLMYEMTVDSADVVVNKVDLAKQELTVIGNPNGTEGFNKGPWDVQAEEASNIYRVTSANYSNGFRTSSIQHNVPFKYTTVNGEANPAGDMIPTRFVFDRPIYLTGKNTGYCFVLLTNSTQPAGTGIEALEQTYQVFIAQTGELTSHGEYATPVHRVGTLEAGEVERNYILGTQTQLTNIPTSGGVLFKSINGWTWESDQRADMKFKIHKAKFNTQTNAQVEFVNKQLSFVPLDLDPFETVIGESMIRVYHKNHNIPCDTANNKVGKVRFIGLPAQGTINGIPYQTIMRSTGYSISSPTLDSYVIDVSEYGGTHQATSSGRTGGTSVLATDSVRYEEFMVIANTIELPDTDISWRISGVQSRAPYDPSQTPYESIPELNFDPNEDVAMPASAQICSDLDETNFLGTSGHSLKIVATLSSKNENISPVIDAQRLGFVTKSVRLNDPKGLGEEDNNINRNINNPLFDQYICLPTTSGVTPAVSLATLANSKLYFTDTDNKLTGSSFSSSGTTITGVGSLFTVELAVGDTVKHPSNNETRTVVEVLSDTSFIINDPFSSALAGSSTLLYNQPYLKIKTADADVAVHLSKLDVGKYLSLEGTNFFSGTTIPMRDFTEKKILSVKYTPTSTLMDSQLGAPCLCEITVEHYLSAGATAGFETGQPANATGRDDLKLTQLDRFIDEIAPMGGSCAYKYVSKIMKITNPANTLKVLFDGCKPEYAHIDLYYKTGGQTDLANFGTKNWKKLEYSIEKNGALKYAEPANNPSLDSFSEYEANALLIAPFTIAQIKIVLRGGAAPLYPKIRNLRILALEE